MIGFLAGVLVAIISCFCYNLYSKKQAEKESRERERQRAALLEKANSGDESARQQYNTFDIDR